MSEISQGISSGFMRNLLTLAAIVCGVFYIEHHITEAITDSLNPIKGQVDGHEIRVTGLEQRGILTDYKLKLYEENIQAFIKPEEIKRKKAR